VQRQPPEFELIAYRRSVYMQSIIMALLWLHTAIATRSTVGAPYPSSPFAVQVDGRTLPIVGFPMFPASISWAQPAV